MNWSNWLWWWRWLNSGLDGEVAAEAEVAR